MGPLALSQRRGKGHLESFESYGKRLFYSRSCCSEWRRKIRSCKVGLPCFLERTGLIILNCLGSEVNRITHKNAIFKKTNKPRCSNIRTYIHIYKISVYFLKVELVLFTFWRLHDNLTQCIKLFLDGRLSHNIWNFQETTLKCKLQLSEECFFFVLFSLSLLTLSPATVCAGW